MWMALLVLESHYIYALKKLYNKNMNKLTKKTAHKKGTTQGFKYLPVK